MNIDDVLALARETLEPKLTPFGLESVEVRSCTDWVGEESFSVTARVHPNSPVVPGDVTLDAMGALSPALLMNDEERFPYLRSDHQDETSIEDDVRPAGFDH